MRHQNNIDTTASSNWIDIHGSYLVLLETSVSALFDKSNDLIFISVYQVVLNIYIYIETETKYIHMHIYEYI